MVIAHSKLTAQGQIAVPAEVRKNLGVGLGSILESDDSGKQIVVRRAGRYSSEEIHRAVFPQGPQQPRKPGELKEGILQAVRKRHVLR